MYSTFNKILRGFDPWTLPVTPCHYYILLKKTLNSLLFTSTDRLPIKKITLRIKQNINY